MQNDTSFNRQIQEFTLANSKSLSKEVLQRIEQYARECQHIRFGMWELVEFLASKPLSTIDSCFNSELSFGTAGFRAEMSPGTNRMNPVSVIKVCSGIAEYLEKDLLLKPSLTQSYSIIIGHDHRHFSQYFALKAASLFASKGFGILTFSSPIPTPLVPFCIEEHSASFGIMITASHNSKEYNGIKVYSSQGTQISKPTDELIMSRIKQINLDLPLIEYSSMYSSKDIFPKAKRDYSDYLNRFVLLSSFYLKITFTAFHGVGFSWAQRCCFYNFDNIKVYPVKEQQEPDADFPTLPKPNPEIDDSLKMGIQNAIQNNCHLLVAVDPDADRFRAIEFIRSNYHSPPNPIMFNGNQLAIIMMAFTYSVCKRQEKLALVTTKVSSKVPLIFGESKGIEVVITDTGFKNIGKEVQRLQREGFRIILAFEEAIGFIPGALLDPAIHGNYLIPDKDGLAAMTAFLSAAGRIYTNFPSLKEFLNRICDENRIWFASCNRTFPMNEANQGRLNLFSLCQQLNDDSSSKTPISPFFHIKNAHLESPSFLTIEFISTTTTSNEHEICWIALRASGTEPIMKLYSEIISRKTPEATEILPSLIDEFCAKYSPYWN